MLQIKFQIAVSDGKFICRDEILQFRFYGQLCIMKVCDICDHTDQLSRTIQTVAASMDKFHISHNSKEQQSFSSSKFYKVTKETKVFISTNGEVEDNPEKILLCDVGGLDHQISTLKEIASIQLQNPKSKKISGTQRGKLNYS